MERSANAVTVDMDLMASGLSMTRTVAKATKGAPLASAVSLRTVDGRLELYATDGRHSVQVSIPCQGTLGDTRAVSVSRLVPLVSTASRRQNKRAPTVGLELRESGAKLAVQVPGRYFELETLTTEDMEPPAQVAEDATEVVYGMPTELREALEFALPAAAPEKDGPVLGGVLFSDDQLAGCNGHRIHATGGFPNLARPRGATLPSSAAKPLAAMLKHVQASHVVARYDDGAAVFSFHMQGRGGLEATLIARAPGEALPNFQPMLRAVKGAAVVELATGAFGDAMKLAAEVATLKGTCVLMANAEEGSLTVHAAEEDNTSGSDYLKAQVSGTREPLRFVLNTHYALQATATMGPRIRLEVHADAQKPVRLLGENPRRVAVVMRAERDSEEPMVEVAVAAKPSAEKPEATE